MADQSVFKMVQSGRAVEDISLQIEAAIIEGKILPGEKLPSERDLQVYFGTGRGVVREALRILKQKDLIKVKKGAKGGAFIKEVGMANVSASLSLFLKQKRINPEELVEARESIDRIITMLAITRGSAEDKALLYEKACHFQELIERDPDNLDVISETDRDLNIRLAKLSGNSLFEWIMRAIQSGFSSYDFALYEDQNYRQQTVENWLETAREIKNGEIMKALSHIGAHYSLLRKCIREKSEIYLQQETELFSSEATAGGEN